MLASLSVCCSQDRNSKERKIIFHSANRFYCCQPYDLVTTILFSQSRVAKDHQEQMTELLVLYPKEMKSGSEILCTPMVISALFTLAKLWKQSKCPSSDEWIKKNLVYT